jgi:hypothetical protein
LRRWDICVGVLKLRGLRFEGGGLGIWVVVGVLAREGAGVWFRMCWRCILWVGVVSVGGWEGFVVDTGIGREGKGMRSEEGGVLVGVLPGIQGRDGGEDLALGEMGGS